MSNAKDKVLYVVRTWVPEDKLEEWNEWHTNVHVRDVAAQPQVRRAWKYRVADDNTPAEWTAQYITSYEFNSWDDWQSYTNGEAAALLRKDNADHYGSVGKISRQVLIQEGATWEK